MAAGGDTYGIPDAALAQEQRILQSGAITPNAATMQLLLSAFRQERLLLRLCEATEKLANRSKPGPKPKAKPKPQTTSNAKAG